MRNDVRTLGLELESESKEDGVANLLRGESSLISQEPERGPPATKATGLIFTAETRSSQRSEYLLINNSLLCVLGASAVNSLLKRYDQNSHRKFAKAARAF